MSYSMALLNQRSLTFTSLITLSLLIPLTHSKILDHSLLLLNSREGHMEEIQAVSGNAAELPCDLSVSAGDKIRLVLWSRNNTVIYSLDSREKQVEEAQHWSNEQVLGGRAYFRISSHPPSLIIENIKESDSGLYKCRLDFKKSPTVHRNINLTIIIPPRRVVIVDERGVDLNSHNIGPYNEGSSLRLTCVSTGGRPVPKVSWWRENALLDDSCEVSSEHVLSTVVSNTLTLEKLQRSDLHARLTCQATNSNISIPVSTTVSLEMSFRPLEVRILEGKQPLSADVLHTLKCQAKGARPVAQISWWRGTSRLKSHQESTSTDGNLTTSTLTFVPSLEDTDKYLSCRAENPLIPGSAIEDGWKMEIHYIPQVSLELGSKLNASQIREGDDAYFECSIKANPWITRVSWRHNGRLLSHNTSAGVIISNQSLVLQTITRRHGGLYSCSATNKEGDGSSNSVFLNIKFAPFCKPNQQTVYGIGRQEASKIYCEVDSNPDMGLQFRWKFNNSAESIDIQQSHFSVDRIRSTLTYKPMTELDYGTVLCWASNESGSQQVPCVYHIIPAGKPDAVSNCSIINQTYDSLALGCLEGFNGGLLQNFFLEILDFHSHSVIRNLTSPKPVFTLRNLDPGSSFIVRVYAVNSKGRSDTQVLQASTLKVAEKQTGITANAASSSYKPGFLQNFPIFAILIGIVATLILVSIVIVIVLRSRGHSGEDKRLPKNNGINKPPAEHEPLTVPLKKSIIDDIDGDDKNPDVVPHGSEIEGVDPDEKVFLERLNNTSRFYETIPRAVRTTPAHHQPGVGSESVLVATSKGINGASNRHLCNVREEITYAELSLPSSPVAYAAAASQTTFGHLPYPSSSTSPAHRVHSHGQQTEPTIYAQIDPLRSGSLVPLCQYSPSSNCSTAPLVGVSEQQTQTVGPYPSTHLHPIHRQQSPTPAPSTEVDMFFHPDARFNFLPPPLPQLHLHPMEEYVRLRPESSHAVYASSTSNATNLRF